MHTKIFILSVLCLCWCVNCFAKKTNGNQSINLKTSCRLFLTFLRACTRTVSPKPVSSGPSRRFVTFVPCRSTCCLCVYNVYRTVFHMYPLSVDCTHRRFLFAGNTRLGSCFSLRSIMLKTYCEI